MWVIKVQFGNGTWYRGVLDSRVEEQTARRILIGNFKELFPDYEIKRRGGGTFRIYHSFGMPPRLVRNFPKKKRKYTKKVKPTAEETVKPAVGQGTSRKKSIFSIFRGKYGNEN